MTEDNAYNHGPMDAAGEISAALRLERMQYAAERTLLEADAPGLESILEESYARGAENAAGYAELLERELELVRATIRAEEENFSADPNADDFAQIVREALA